MHSKVPSITLTFDQPSASVGVTRDFNPLHGPFKCRQGLLWVSEGRSPQVLYNEIVPSRRFYYPFTSFT